MELTTEKTDEGNRAKRPLFLSLSFIYSLKNLGIVACPNFGITIRKSLQLASWIPF
jgi:hypothetical protein